MGESKEPADRTAWKKLFREQLRKYPDPLEFQQEIISIMLDILPSKVDEKPRAIDKHDTTARTGFLAKVFGDTVHVKILEALLQYPGDWFNLNDLAIISVSGKASVKRVVDAIKASALDVLEEQAPQGKERERLVKLKDTPVTRELRFFYMKLRGLC